MSLKSSINKIVVEASADEHDVRNLLRKDHEEALALAKEMAETDDASKRKLLLAKLKPALVAHSRAEEAEVYDQLISIRDDKDARGIGHEGYVEHHLLDELLSGLSKAKAADAEQWQAKAKVLFELLDHHIEEEHGEMFSELGKHFDSEQLVAMGKSFDKAKHRVLQTSAAA